MEVSRDPWSIDLFCKAPAPELADLKMRFKLDVPGQGESAARIRAEFVADLERALG